ncbi:MAG: GMC family oxidoreductase [Oligoflexales bacterium]|nr:GMC family oxidoreductase [Oligoflexales bacterium]
MENHTYDFCIVGSGFGGSVSALRLAEKGYKVAVVEKGQRFRTKDFPKTNWNLKKWFWIPWFNWRGFFKMTFLRHLTVYSGVGVGGGSLVYASTLPVPKDHFFKAPSWAHLANWKDELLQHYQTARKMLGVSTNPKLTYSDKIMADLAKVTPNKCPTH